MKGFATVSVGQTTILSDAKFSIPAKAGGFKEWILKAKVMLASESENKACVSHPSFPDSICDTAKVIGNHSEAMRVCENIPANAVPCP